jgi:hypothetical protein
MIDFYEDNDEPSPVRFLSLLSGTNAHLGLGAHYALTDRLSLDLGYEFQVLRIKPWDSLLSTSDNVLFGFTVGF